MGGHTTSVSDPVKPCGQAAGDHNQWTMFIQPATIDRALRGEGSLRGGHEYIVTRERDRGAMRGMKARLFDHPCRPTVAADAEPDCGGGHHGVRTVWVRANLMDVAIDVDSGLPSYATVHRARDTADMDVGEEHRPIRSCGYGTDPERRSDALTIYHGRARVPLIASGDLVEAAELLDLSGRADAQDACIVGPDVDNAADRHTTSEIELRGGDRAPNAVGRATVKRASVDDSEGAAMPVRGERSDRAMDEILAARPT
jgi:hypothetical protein